MPAIQSLKKQLKGIRSTRKLTKAMKTISTVKFSKLNSIYGEYSAYANECSKLFEKYGSEFSQAFKAKNTGAPTAVVVFASNKGLCGSFNSELLSYAVEQLEKMDNYLLIACGKKAINYFKLKDIPIEKEFILNDIPNYEDSVEMLDYLIDLRKDGRASKLLIVYSEYKNMMTQRPAITELFAENEKPETQAPLFIPDRASVMEKAAITVYRCVFHRIVLESAIGAQAATLTTMRSAYDTATDYCTALEGQINRMRQSAVTADVIEISSERSE